MDNLLDNILEFCQTLDIVYVYIFLGSFAGILLLNIIIKLVRKNLKKRKDEKSSSNTGGQAFDYINQFNAEEATEEVVEKSVDDSKVNKKGKKNSKLEEARIKAINAYNTLYDLHFNAGYSVNLEHNQVLAYYNSFILGTNETNDLDFIAAEITTQAQNMYTDMNKQYYDEQKKTYQENCAAQMVELEKLFELASVDGKTILKKYNDKLLLINDFATLDEFQTLSVEIQRNIDYMKDKYSKVFEEKYDVKETIDAEFIKSLKILQCDPKERDRDKIRQKYIELIKQCHPDLSNGKNINISLDYKAIASAYDYIKRNLKK